MSPKFVDKNQKVKEIAGFARSIFSQKGYGAASVEQISVAAGIGKGTIYEYFQTKEDLFVVAVVDWLTDGIHRVASLSSEKEDPVERLRGFVTAVETVFPLTDPETVHLLMEMYQQTIMRGGALNKTPHVMKELRNRVCRIIADILLDGVSRHSFKPEVARDAERIAINLLAFLDGIWLHHLLVDDFADQKGCVDFFMEQLIGSITLETGQSVALSGIS